MSRDRDELTHCSDEVSVMGMDHMLPKALAVAQQRGRVIQYNNI
jgi:hypothetical protein